MCGAIFVRGYTLNLRGRMLRRPRAFEIHTCSTARLVFQRVLNSKVQIEHTTSLEACNSGSPRMTSIGTNCHMSPLFVQNVLFHRVQDEYSLACLARVACIPGVIAEGLANDATKAFGRGLQCGNAAGDRPRFRATRGRYEPRARRICESDMLVPSIAIK